MSRCLLAVVLVVGLLATACSTDGAGGSDGDTDEVAGVDVGTAELRTQRAAAGIPACPDDVRIGSGQVEGGLPELTLPCLGGGQDVELASLRGPLVVNMWASWCVPCRAELPYFDRLDSAGVPVLGVDFQDTQPDQALALAAEAGVSYPSVADVEGAVRAPLRVVGMPTTVFVDRAGRVTATLAQEFTSYEQLVAAVGEHLGVEL
jgi:cytochrome c biogenesis protein CcmG, thiol:disulfide interchange protein DsbE